MSRLQRHSALEFELSDNLDNLTGQQHDPAPRANRAVAWLSLAVLDIFSRATLGH